MRTHEDKDSSGEDVGIQDLKRAVERRVCILIRLTGKWGKLPGISGRLQIWRGIGNLLEGSKYVTE